MYFTFSSTILRRTLKLNCLLASFLVYKKYFNRERQTIYSKTNTFHDLYLWGNGRSDNSADYENFKPHKIEMFKDINGKDISDKFKYIRTVEFGDYFTAVVNESGEAYIWITPFLMGEDEENPKNKVREGIIKVSNNLKIKEIKFTNEKLFLLTENGDLYLYSLVIGKVVHQGHLVKDTDMPDELNISSELIKIQEIKNCKQIATGKDHILMLLNNGDLYAMGDDSFGQLGLDTFSEERLRQMRSYGNFAERREKRPKKVPINNVKKIACGDNHSLILDSNSNVYGMGYNRYLQLSNDDLYREKYIGINKPTLIKINTNEGSNIKVIDIGCSSNCSFFLTETTMQGRKDDIYSKAFEIYSSGEGLKGTLGINLIKHINDIEILSDISGLYNKENLKPIQFQSFACGNQHCILLFKNPRIAYVWGNNEYGELGTKNRVFYESPMPMLEEYILPNKLIKVFAGKNNTGFICQKRDQVKVEEILRKDEAKYQEELRERKLKREKLKKSQDKEENSNKETKQESIIDQQDKTLFQVSVEFLKKYL